MKASDGSATLTAGLEQRIASLEGGATAEAVTTPRQPLQPAARPQPVASSSAASVSDARAFASRRGGQKHQKKKLLACPSCGIAHLPTTWPRHDEYIKCLGAAKKQRICSCCSKTISASSLEAHEVTCFEDFLGKWDPMKPLTAIINVKYPLPLDDRRESFCPSTECIDTFLEMDSDGAAGSTNKGSKKQKTKAEMVRYFREAHLDEQSGTAWVREDVHCQLLEESYKLTDSAKEAKVRPTAA